MDHHSDSGQRTDHPAGPAGIPPRTAPGPGHDPRAATGNGIGGDPDRTAAAAGTDPSGGPGTAPASEDGRRDGRARADADCEPEGPEGTVVNGPDRHNATEDDPSATATPPGNGSATRSSDDTPTT